jgi:hypothetical protein
MSRSNFRATATIALALTIAACGFASAVRAQEAPVVPKPLPEHEILQKDVGTWDATIKSWDKPDGEPMESKAVEKNELLPGGYWLLSRFDGSFGDFKFTGIGQFGYDPHQKKYIGTWIDNMSPYLMLTKADYDPATQTMTGTGETREPGTNKVVTTRSVSRHVDDNTRWFAMYTKGDDGKEWKMMEITYKRRTK